MIRINHLHKSYVNGNNSLHVLKGIDLEVKQGEFVSIMGSSGSGKSTLLNIIGILDNYDEGMYELDNVAVKDLNENQAADYRNRFIGFVFQSFNLISYKSALENVALPLYYQGVKRKIRNQMALDYLEKVGLGDRAHHLPSEMSGGQKQRVALARALITKPKIILADEPTGALDSQTSYEVMELFKSVHRQGMTIVLVTHEQDIAEMTEKTIFMKDGVVEQIYKNKPMGSQAELVHEVPLKQQQ